MSRFQSLLAMTVAGLVGGGCAMGAMLLAEASAPTTADPPIRSDAGATRERQEPTVEPRLDERTRLVRVERQLERLVSAPASQPVSAPTADHEPDAEPLADPEAQARAAEAAWFGSIDRHEAEPTDAGWANETETVLQRELSAALQGASDEIEVDCRSESCLASVEFGDYTEATTMFASLLQHAYSMNCAITVAAPEPDDPSARYTTDVLFDCGSA